jgi:hypothetical protein
MPSHQTPGAEAEQLILRATTMSRPPATIMEDTFGRISFLISWIFQAPLQLCKKVMSSVRDCELLEPAKPFARPAGRLYCNVTALQSSASTEPEFTSIHLGGTLHCQPRICSLPLTLLLPSHLRPCTPLRVAGNNLNLITSRTK